MAVGENIMKTGNSIFRIRFPCWLLSLACLVWNAPVFAEDVIRIQLSQSDKDQRVTYKYELLKAALEITREEFGPYRLKVEVFRMNRERALVELIKGEIINLHIAPADLDWEAVALPVRIPIRRGLLDYRLVLAHKDVSQLLSQVKSVAELKRYSVGLRKRWTTTKILRELDFEIVESTTYDGFFSMLSLQRYKFTVQGINEVFGVMEARKEELEDIRIVPGIAVKIPLPVYFYASLRTPRVAERIESGLNRLIDNGDFDRIFLRYFEKSIQKAQLWERRIIDIGNPLLPKTVPYNEKKYWFNPISG